MSQTGIAYMKAQMEAYFSKVKAAITTGGSASFKYRTGTIPASGSVTIDAPTDLGFTAADYNVYSLGIQLSINDPAVGTNPPVIGAEAVLRYEIQSDGKVILRNNHTAQVTYYARFTLPVKK